jgi:hypothetical protein
LRVALQQGSFSIQAPDRTIFVSHREQPLHQPTGAAADVAAPERN